MTNHTHLPSLGDHYSQLLGLVEPWTIENIDLNVDQATLDIHVIEQDATAFPCPECGTSSKLYDHAPERRWRHLDTMQFTTEIVARLPRVSCQTHGVKTVGVPWADPHARWTLLFERFAILVLESTSNITRAMALLKIGWDQAQAIRTRAVERGLARRTKETIDHVGIDEKSFLAGHQYASLMTDLDQGRVLDVVQDRTTESAKMLKRHLDGLLAHCLHDITNAVTEGLNSKIQFVKASARGFRTFQNYRIAILFYCGKLDMLPL